MEGRLLIKDCAVFRADGRFRTGMGVIVQDGKIARVAQDSEVLVLPGDWAVASRGRLLVPGLVDCHAHLVKGQLMPAIAEFMLRNPGERSELERRMDAQLTAAEVEIISAFGIARALRSGVTMIVEHLHCPSDVAGALAVQGRAAETLGMRFVNSHATHSAAGESAAARQAEANATVAEQSRSHPSVRCSLGFHASYSCGDDLLSRLGRMHQDLGVGVHYHLAESEDDVIRTFTRYGQRIAPRLEALGLLGPGCIAAYARAIDRSEAELMSKTRTAIAISPFATSTSEPCGSSLETLVVEQRFLTLGTSGSVSLWDELFSAFDSAIRLARLGRLLDPDGMMADLLFNAPAQVGLQIFRSPFGNIEEGNLADLVLYDCVPTQQGSDGLSPHILLQLGRSPVAWTIVGGRVVVREGQLLSHDYLQLAAEADRVRQLLWNKTGVRFAQTDARGAI